MVSILSIPRRLCRWQHMLLKRLGRLILYNHHTSENWDDQPADEILNVFDVYNDPAVICQWGFMRLSF